MDPLPPGYTEAEVRTVGKTPIVISYPSGPKGDSAYEVAVENGFDGTEAEWLASLNADAYHEFSQNNPASTWGPIAHNLGKYPSFGVRLSTGELLDPGVTHIDKNNSLLTFAVPQSGVAFFN